MTLIAEGEMVTALEFSFTGQPTSLAPTLSPPGPETPSLNINDTLHTALIEKVANGASLLGAQFAVELDLQRSEASYIAETDAEKSEIAVSRFAYDEKSNQPISLPYDMVTRAMMAAEQPLIGDHRLFAALHAAARQAIEQGRYIDSFRYSFLVFDALFSQGQFKKRELEKAFRSSVSFMNAIRGALAEYSGMMGRKQSVTSAIVQAKPTPEEFSDHLIERRGHYFHSNQQKSSAWQPHQQDEACDLAFLSVAIALQLSSTFAEPMFEEGLTLRHFDEARSSGAIVVLRIEYTFVDDGGKDKPQGAILNYNAPGTKVTRALATGIMKSFMNDFTAKHVGESLISARCTNNGAVIFEIAFRKDLP